MESKTPRVSASGIEEIRTPELGLLALVIRKTFRGEKYNFPTPPDFALQLGINFYSAGDTITAHRHLPRPRQFTQTQEFITISTGEVLLHLFDNDNKPVTTVPLAEGDSVLLVSGGHSFDVRRDCKITEVKLGPYDEAKDKIRF